jgi:hypothetical protein
MRFDCDAASAEPVEIGGYFHFLVVDLGRQKKTRSILDSLRSAYPVARSRKERRLHGLLGPRNRRLVEKAVRAISRGDARLLGRAMSESQIEFQRAALPLARNDLDSPRLYSVLTDPMVVRGTYGGKGVGSHGDGAAQLLCKSLDVRSSLARYIRDSLGYESLSLDIPEISF